jgi:hypothetical protein
MAATKRKTITVRSVGTPCDAGLRSIAELIMKRVESGKFVSEKNYETLNLPDDSGSPLPALIEG